MHNTPQYIYDEIESERVPCERAALFQDHVCQGRSTMEHAWLNAGRQMNEKWTIIRSCAWAHSTGRFQTSGGGLDKQKNEYISLLHAADADLAKYPRKDFRKTYLMKKYGAFSDTTKLFKPVPTPTLVFHEKGAIVVK